MLENPVYTMKTKYLFIKCVDVISLDTLIVDVYVGRSKQEQRDADFISSLSQFTDYFWHKYDDGCVSFIRNIANSLGSGPSGHATHLPRCEMSVSKLRRLIKSEDYDRWASTFINASRALSLRQFSANDTYHLAVNAADKLACNAANVENLKLGRVAV